jgi:hypothetical protein
MTGMASDGSVEAYTEGTFSTAVSSMSPDDRAAQLMAEANQSLAAEGVPGVYHDWGANGTSDYGYFDASTWTMSLNEHYFSETSFDVTQLENNYREALQTVYHEARHAEQTFRCLREVIGLGATPDQAIAAMQAGSAPVPPLWVADQAALNPILQCDTSQNEAAQWYESMYGSGSQHRSDVLNHPEAADYNQQYHALPEESDAWSTDGEVGDEFRREGGI